MEELLTMSKKEIDRADIMRRVQEKRLSQAKAAKILAITDRHLRRLWRGYKSEGTKSLISKKRGRPSNRRLDRDIIDTATKLLIKNYADFGPTFATEKLEIHGIKISIETTRKLLIDLELWKPKRIKKPRIHQMRPRRSQVGELQQIDGSPHAWFEDRGPLWFFACMYR